MLQGWAAGVMLAEFPGLQNAMPRGKRAPVLSAGSIEGILRAQPFFQQFSLCSRSPISGWSGLLLTLEMIPE